MPGGSSCIPYAPQGVKGFDDEAGECNRRLEKYDE